MKVLYDVVGKPYMMFLGE